MMETQDTIELPSAREGQVDLSPLLGTWVNSNDATKWIKKLILARKGDSFTLQAFAVEEPTDWGEVEITTYREHTGELGFHAVYKVGSIESVFAANVNKELIVIVCFYQFKDGSGRENTLCREFYFREPSST